MKLNKNTYFFIILSATICFYVSSVYSDSQQLSGTTAEEFIADVRISYNDSSDHYFTDSVLLQFLNDGCRYISSVYKPMEQTEEIKLQDDTIEYPITWIYVNPEYVTLGNSDGVYGLKKGRVKDVNLETDDLDSPRAWYEFNNKIGVYPVGTLTDDVPTFGGDDITLGGDDVTFGNEETITLYLKERPYDIIKSDWPKIPANYDNKLKMYILARMALKDKKLNLYNHYWSQFIGDRLKNE